MTTNTNTQVMQQALDALTAMQMEAAARSCGLKIADDAIDALRAAIAQPVEPAALPLPADYYELVNKLLNHIEDVLDDEAWESIDVKQWNAVTSQLKVGQPAPAGSGDAAILLKRASKQLSAWIEKYGEWKPYWLPPAGDVRLQEDIDAYLQPPPAGDKQVAQPAPAAPYQVTDEDVEVACNVLCLSRHPSVVLLVRRALEAYEARKAAA